MPQLSVTCNSSKSCRASQLVLQARRRRGACSLVGVWLLLSALFSGCNGRQSPSELPAEQTAAVTVSNVPLRIQIVGEVSDMAMIERQWLADSEQPIEITQVDVPAFLAAEQCPCDVVLFPSRLLGEVVERNWLNKLPAAVAAGADDEPWELSRADRAQATYDGELYGVPLACSIPVFLASDALASAVGEGPAEWSQVLAGLEQSEAATSEGAFLDGGSQAALVDRFLAIVATLTDRNPTYGLLFELQTMKPRLAEPEFVRAAEILAALSRQPTADVSSVLMTHEAAWRWVASDSAPRLAIASSALIGDEAGRMDAGKVLPFQGSLPGWNTGGGLLAALADDCRQTSRAVEFLRWLRQPQTKNALAPVIVGVQGTPAGGADSLAWQAQQHLVEALASPGLPREPSLPQAESLRNALGDCLLRMLEGKVSPAQAMATAVQEWQTLVADRKNALRTEYEKSLGLTL